MIRVSVLYENGPGTIFDHGYYRTKHIPLAVARLGTALKGYSPEEGLSGGASEEDPPFVAAVHLMFDTLTDFQAAFAPVIDELVADRDNYTNITPVTQISRVVIEQ
jgi:uncharacterized protein (TIGR02118 family)